MNTQSTQASWVWTILYWLSTAAIGALTLFGVSQLVVKVM
jgi:hypothetical protein